MKFEYLTGDATKPTGDGQILICHVCNTIGGWGAGFVMGLNKTFGKDIGSPRDAYLKWFKNGHYSSKNIEVPFALGEIQIVRVAPNTAVVNMIGQRGIGVWNGIPPIRYEAIRDCFLSLKNVVEPYIKKGGTITLAGPRFGAGLAGGNWTKIETIVEEALHDLDITFKIYDLPN